MSQSLILDRRTKEHIFVSRKGAKDAEIYWHTEITECHRIFWHKNIFVSTLRGRRFAILCALAWGNYTPQGIRVNSCPFVAQKIRVDTRKYVETFLGIPCIAFPSQVRTATFSSVWNSSRKGAKFRKASAWFCVICVQYFWHKNKST